ncbi:CRISPR-associated endonuclease/helicase Cas3 [Herbihabitans rhizosphaerae]|uniref:CRISPR-associated endonuclease/helicase Cas3 n=1 Tax=Herbihabitans rhizosphaerae TaxID=1872711 RepID=A0A4V2EUI7_9PSEU|nr:CRISPR-associated helicase Cas3' [Herbihabitans rhizosphaerae]RZS44713.1 CRISPR-associated endonuclease/helicase Cas3 [Herbihabitans rhizosphaerae]
MTVTFNELVRRATGGVHSPFPYQERVAAEGLPDVLTSPTGTGKTLAAALPWLFRRLTRPDETPRWLVIVLPQRALVEQTVDKIREWIERLGEDVPVHVLMGGEDADDREWKARPDRTRIFVGTQDMILSRLLMRGFAESRSAWPMSFGLLHADVQFVFDEVQLMGPGLPTSLQLQGFREKLGTAAPCRTMWMSATLDPAKLSTMDFDRKPSVIEIGEDDLADSGLATRLNATRTIGRLNLSEVDSKEYPSALADKIAAEHRPGTRTIVVINTVDRATAVYDALTKRRPKARVVLLHSRFRPYDRERLTKEVREAPGDDGVIVVSTQVLEAGVDLGSTTMITETAPWTSIVQRAGRCNRDGTARDARLLWTEPPGGRGSHFPYLPEEHANTATVLSTLDGDAVTGLQLADAATNKTEPEHPLLRRRDLLDLFDTSTDLTGNDIDVSQFIRDAENRTVSVAWRAADNMNEDSGGAVGRTELCPAPIADVRKLVVQPARRAWVFDQIEGRWRDAAADDVRPGAVIVLDAVKGGYLPDRGFAPQSTTTVEVLAAPRVSVEPLEGDRQPARRWVPLGEHLLDTEREAAALLDLLAPAGLSEEHRQAVVLAARYHDLGKAHDTFVRALEKANPDHHQDKPEAPWAKSPGGSRLEYDPKYFRHELASALWLLADKDRLLPGVLESDLVAYLALAHHGKVRLSVRARENEAAGHVLGVRHGSSTMDFQFPDGTTVRGCELSLEATELGRGSLTERALRLRDRPDLGPFRVAFCEAVVRAADWQSSAGYDGGAT